MQILRSDLICTPSFPFLQALLKMPFFDPDSSVVFLFFFFLTSKGENLSFSQVRAPGHSTGGSPLGLWQRPQPSEDEAGPTPRMAAAPGLAPVPPVPQRQLPLAKAKFEAFITTRMRS